MTTTLGPGLAFLAWITRHNVAVLPGHCLAGEYKADTNYSKTEAVPSVFSILSAHVGPTGADHAFLLVVVVADSGGCLA